MYACIATVWLLFNPYMAADNKPPRIFSTTEACNEALKKETTIGFQCTEVCEENQL